MIDSDDIKRLIAKRKAFTIGKRGISVKCYPTINNGWSIAISRAEVYIDVRDISILEDEDFYDLTIDVNGSGEYHSLVDLTLYTKLTAGF